jgi:hypothetical protein
MEHSGSWESDNQLAGQKNLNMFPNPRLLDIFTGSSDWTLLRANWNQSTSFYSISLTRIFILYSLPLPNPLSALLHAYPIQCLHSNPPKCRVHHIVLHFITTLIFNDGYKLWHSSLYMIFGILIFLLSFIVAFSSTANSQRPSVYVLQFGRKATFLFCTK